MNCRCTEEAKKRVPLKLEQQLTIVKLQMFNDHFNEADEEKKGGVTKIQFRQAVRDTIGEHVTNDDADTVFMKVDTYDTGIVTWEVRFSHLSVTCTRDASVSARKHTGSSDLRRMKETLP